MRVRPATLNPQTGSASTRKGQQAMSRVICPVAVVDYPYSDGQPMAESEFQLVAMLYLPTVLRTH